MSRHAPLFIRFAEYHLKTKQNRRVAALASKIHGVFFNSIRFADGSDVPTTYIPVDPFPDDPENLFKSFEEWLLTQYPNLRPPAPAAIQPLVGDGGAPPQDPMPNHDAPPQPAVGTAPSQLAVGAGGASLQPADAVVTQDLDAIAKQVEDMEHNAKLASLEARRVEALRLMEAARAKTVEAEEARKREAARVEALRLEAEEAQKREAARVEALKLEAAKAEAQKVEAMAEAQRLKEAAAALAAKEEENRRLAEEARKLREAAEEQARITAEAIQRREAETRMREAEARTRAYIAAQIAKEEAQMRETTRAEAERREAARAEAEKRETKISAYTTGRVEDGSGKQKRKRDSDDEAEHGPKEPKRKREMTFMGMVVNTVTEFAVDFVGAATSLLTDPEEWKKIGGETDNA